MAVSLFDDRTKVRKKRWNVRRAPCLFFASVFRGGRSGCPFFRQFCLCFRKRWSGRREVRTVFRMRACGVSICPAQWFAYPGQSRVPGVRKVGPANGRDGMADRIYRTADRKFCQPSRPNRFTSGFFRLADCISAGPTGQHKSSGLPPGRPGNRPLLAVKSARRQVAGRRTYSKMCLP